MTLILLTGSGRFLRDLWSLQRASIGLDSERVVVAQVLLRAPFRPAANQHAFFDELETRVRALPGISAFAVSDSLPLAGPAHSMIYSLMRVEGSTPMPEGTGGMVAWRRVTPEYFPALRIPIVRGRPFLEEDRNSGEDVIVVSERLERRLSPGASLVGKRLHISTNPSWFTVAGIAGDVNNAGLDGAQDPEYYVCRKRSAAQIEPRHWVIVRTTLAPARIAGELQRALHALDPELPVTTELLDERVTRLAARPRFTASLLSGFAVVALLLASLGLYSVMAFLVTQRTREIGIRLALGATPDRIRVWVLARAGIWLAAGLGLGVVGALFFRLKPGDLPVLAGSLVTLALAGALAAWLPARRAAGVAPGEALRAE